MGERLVFLKVRLHERLRAQVAVMLAYMGGEIHWALYARSKQSVNCTHAVNPTPILACKAQTLSGITKQDVFSLRHSIYRDVYHHLTSFLHGLESEVPYVVSQLLN